MTEPTTTNLQQDDTQIEAAEKVDTLLQTAETEENLVKQLEVLDKAVEVNAGLPNNTDST